MMPALRFSPLSGAMLLPFLFAIAPGAGAQPAGDHCIDVEVEGARQPAFECLNAHLKATAQSAAPSDPDAARNAVVGNAEPNKVGTFSHTGVAIQMGANFGKSAFPQRPSAPVYTNALTAKGKP